MNIFIDLYKSPGAALSLGVAPFKSLFAMNENFIYNCPDKIFVHCFHPQCPRADECLRHLSAQHIPADIKRVVALNPNNVSPDDAGCPMFLPSEKVRIAWGTRGMFDDLPLKAAKAIRKTLILHFGKTRFFRLQRKESCLTPAEQDYIRRVFLRHGVTSEPVYEFYTEEYQWD